MNADIVCRNLTAAFTGDNGAKRVVLNQLDAIFPAGRVSVISGAIGAGKSTFLNILSGLMRPTAGEVIVNGQAVSRWVGAHRDRWRRQAGIVFQHHHLLHDLTVMENVMLPLIPLGRSLSECRRKSAEALRKVALFGHAGNPVSTLSGGERQKAAIARALVSRPLYIFADEPTAHQDPDSAGQILALLGDCARRGSVVIVATHETGRQRFPDVGDRYELDSGYLHPLVR